MPFRCTRRCLGHTSNTPRAGGPGPRCRQQPSGKRRAALAVFRGPHQWRTALLAAQESAARTQLLTRRFLTAMRGRRVSIRPAGPRPTPSHGGQRSPQRKGNCISRRRPPGPPAPAHRSAPAEQNAAPQQTASPTDPQKAPTRFYLVSYAARFEDRVMVAARRRHTAGGDRALTEAAQPLLRRRPAQGSRSGGH